MYDNKIYSLFLEFLKDSLNDHLQYLKDSIINNSEYQYGNISDKIKILEDLKEDQKTFHFNHFKSQGVIYDNGHIELVIEEVKELIKYCDINLENNKYGLFLNEKDEEKAPAFKSRMQIIIMICYSLALQFYNSEIEKVKINVENFENLIFSDTKSQKFFEEKIVNEWLRIEENKKTALSYAFRRMSVHIKRENDPVAPFKIKCRATYFVSEYWNKNFSDVLDIKNAKNPKFEEVRSPEPYKAKFDNLESDFTKDYIKIS